MRHSYLVRLIPELLRKLLESVEDPHCVSEGVFPMAHLILDHGDIVRQK